MCLSWFLEEEFVFLLREEREGKEQVDQKKVGVSAGGKLAVKLCTTGSAREAALPQSASHLARRLLTAWAEERHTCLPTLLSCLSPPNCTAPPPGPGLLSLT